MKIWIALTLCFCLLSPAYANPAQRDFPHFSDEFRAVLTRVHYDQIRIDVFRKTENEPLISVEGGAAYGVIDLTTHGVSDSFGNDVSSFLVHEDINFDGKRDFAILWGNPNYGYLDCEAHKHPCYRVFLAQGDGFKENASLSALASGHQNFHVNHIDKQLEILDYHLTYVYKMQNDKAVLYKEIEEELWLTRYLYKTFETHYSSTGQETSIEKLIFVPDKAVSQLSFNLANGKTLFLAIEQDESNDRYISYLLIDKENNVELVYPSPESSLDRDNFTYTEEGNTSAQLAFQKEDARYIIYVNHETKEAGIRVMIGDKKTDMPAIKNSIQGEISSLCHDDPDSVSNVKFPNYCNMKG